MAIGLRDLSNEEAFLVGAELLKRVWLIASPPASGSPAARRAAGRLAAAIEAARVDQGELAGSAAEVVALLARYKQKLGAARAEEKRADGAFAALRTLLLVGVKRGSAEARSLDELLFPGGSSRVTERAGHPKLVKYEEWLLIADHAAARDNPAYGAIAAAVEDFRALVAAFAEALQVKRSHDDAVTFARTARDQAREAWDLSFGDLIDVAARAHGAESDDFRGWIEPLRRVKADRRADQGG